MFRRMLLIVTICSLGLLGTVPQASAGVKQTRSHPASLWLQERWMAWAMGSDTNPLLTPDFCGQMIHGRFFMNAAVDSGVHVHCTIPRGVPLLASPGGYAAWAPSDGHTNQELLDDVVANFAAAGNANATLDGHALDLDHALRYSPVNRIKVGTDSFMRTVDTGFPAGREVTRVASAGWFIVIRPLCHGHHVLKLYDEWGGTPFDITFYIHVR